MQKIFTTLFFLVFISISVTYAQKQQGNFEFGINLGYNSSYVTTNNGFNSTFISGFNAGVAGDYYFSEGWSVKAKVIYDQKGWGEGFITTSGGGQLNNVNYKLNYITIPLTASWHFTDSKNWCLNFGPYVGLLTSAKAGGAANNLDIKQYLNSTDAGLALGVGFKIPISDNSNVFFEYDTQVGATNVVKPTPTDDTSYQLIRGSLNVGISF
jgi:hypothetical protein